MAERTSGAVDEMAVKRELAPTGTLRVAVAVGPAASALWAVKDATTGKPRGVTVELGTALARKLGVPVTLVEYSSSGAIVAAADRDEWDVTFVPVDDERKQALAFGSPYHLLQSTYLVAPGSTIRTLADVDRAEVRVAGVDGTATFRASRRTAPKATPVTVKNPDAAVAMMRAGEVDAIALSRETIVGLLAALPGSRALDGAFLNSTTAVAVAKNKHAARAYVSAFIEEAKTSGLVRRAFDAMGLHSSQVAPVGMEP
jgi:polar amino acid transport system substrate-binding protein